MIAACIEVLAQLVITSTQWQNSASKGALFAFTAGKCVSAAFVLGWPDTFWAHRRVPAPAAIPARDVAM